MQVLDAMIVLTGLYLFGIKAAMYAIVAIFVTTKVSDGLMEGFKYSKSAFIITDQYEKVAKKILLELDRIPVMKSACFTVLFPRNRS